MAGSSIQILLIEDDIDDIDLLKEAFTNNNISHKIDVIMEGDKVSPYLKSNPTLPSIIVMDLNLPKTDGKEILKYIKGLSIYKSVPLVVLSTSSSKEDIEYCISMGAARFLTKPISMAGWESTVNIIAKIAMTAN